MLDEADGSILTRAHILADGESEHHQALPAARQHRRLFGHVPIEQDHVTDGMRTQMLQRELPVGRLTHTEYHANSRMARTVLRIAPLSSTTRTPIIALLLERHTRRGAVVSWWLLNNLVSIHQIRSYRRKEVLAGYYTFLEMPYDRHSSVGGWPDP